MDNITSNPDVNPVYAKASLLWFLAPVSLLGSIKTTSEISKTLKGTLIYLNIYLNSFIGFDSFQ
jgi:hypothetical protein